MLKKKNSKNSKKIVIDDSVIDELKVDKSISVKEEEEQMVDAFLNLTMGGGVPEDEDIDYSGGYIVEPKDFDDYSSDTSDDTSDEEGGRRKVLVKGAIENVYEEVGGDVKKLKDSAIVNMPEEVDVLDIYTGGLSDMNFDDEKKSRAPLVEFDEELPEPELEKFGGLGEIKYDVDELDDKLMDESPKEEPMKEPKPEAAAVTIREDNIDIDDIILGGSIGAEKVQSLLNSYIADIL